MEAFRDLIPL